MKKFLFALPLLFLFSCADSASEPDSKDKDAVSSKPKLETFDRDTLRVALLMVHELSYANASMEFKLNDSQECIEWREKNEQFRYPEREEDYSHWNNWLINYYNIPTQDIVEEAFKIVSWGLPDINHVGAYVEDFQVEIQFSEGLLWDNHGETHRYYKEREMPEFNTNYYILFAKWKNDNNEEFDKWVSENSHIVSEAECSSYLKYNFYIQDFVACGVPKLDSSIFELVKSFKPLGKVFLYRKGTTVIEEL